MARTMTLTADAARLKMRDLLDHVGRGGMVTITRYNRPDAVVISVAEYQRLTADHLKLVKQGDDPAQDIPWEQVQAELDARPVTA